MGSGLGQRFLGGAQLSWPDALGPERAPGVVHGASLVHRTSVEGEGPDACPPWPTGASGGRGALRIATERISTGIAGAKGSHHIRVQANYLMVRSTSEIPVDGDVLRMDVGCPRRTAIGSAGHFA